MVLGDKRPGRCRVGQLQVGGIGQRSCGGEAADIRSGEPGEPRVTGLGPAEAKAGGRGRGGAGGGPRSPAGGTRAGPASPGLGPQKPRQASGYGGAAAVTAIPTTRNVRPFRVIESPTSMPSASAKAASTTTPPSRTQLPWVSLGWLTEAGVVSRPSARTFTVSPSAFSVVQATGNGPLLRATP